MNKKLWIISSSIIGLSTITAVTVIPIVFIVSKAQSSNNNNNNNNDGSNSNNNSSNSNNNGNDSGNTNNGNNNSNSGNTDNNNSSSLYKYNANPINDGGGKYKFATYDKSTNSIIPSVGPNGVTPSEGVPSNSEFARNVLYTDVQAKQAKRTVGISFYRDGRRGINSGTGWILDYKLPNDNSSYPLTWYFATNVHVIQNLRVKNDVITPNRYENIPNSIYNTTEVTFTTLKDYSTNKNLSNFSNYVYTSIIPKVDNNGISNVRTVMVGNDFLKTSPSQFSKLEKYQNNEEYADFAVMEVTFDNEEQAKTVTNNYANDKENQFRYKKESLLAHPEDIKKDDYSIVGYPVVDPVWNYWSSTIAINRPKNITEDEKKKLSNLSSSGFYNTFKDRTGMFDATIGLSFFGTTYSLQPTNNVSEYYLPWGLLYPTDYSALTQGSSGSMMMDSEGYTWGIHFMIDPDASISFSQALYSEGFNYGGAFGKYNLEGYDLIDGGFPNQKKSYRDGLIQLYGKDKDFKTNLYPNGANR